MREDLQKAIVDYKNRAKEAKDALGQTGAAVWALQFSLGGFCRETIRPCIPAINSLAKIASGARS